MPLPIDGPLSVEIDGDFFTVTPDPHAWLRAATDGDIFAMFPTGLPEEQYRLILERLGDEDDILDLADLERCAYEVIEAATGLDWWVALRLLASAAQHFSDFDAWCAYRGIDVRSEPVSRVCASVLAWLRAGSSDEKDLAKLEHKITMPPPSESAGWSSDREADAFKKTASMLPGIKKR